MDRRERDEQWAIWLRAGISGDASAYRAFLNGVTPYLRSIAQRRLKQREGSSDAEDIVQDVLLAIHLKRGTWDVDRPIGPWLAAIVRNKVIDAFRRRGRHINVPIEDVIDTLRTEETVDNPDTKTIERLLSGLKEGQRRIVTAISVEGATIRQTAERFDLSEGAVRVALHRALRTLGAMYRKENGEADR